MRYKFLHKDYFKKVVHAVAVCDKRQSIATAQGTNEKWAVVEFNDEETEDDFYRLIDEKNISLRILITQGKVIYP